MKRSGNGNPVGVGLRVGAILGILALVVTTFYDLALLPSLVQAVEFVIALVGFFVAGFLAARQVGQAKAGLVAGLIASLLPAVVIVGANVVIALVAPQTFAKDFGYHDVTSGQLVVASVVQSLLGFVLWAVIGLVAGVIGGLIGRGRAQRSASEIGKKGEARAMDPPPPPAGPPGGMRPPLWPSGSSLLSLNGAIRWSQMSGKQRGWLIVAYIFLWFFMLPLHGFVYLAQVLVNWLAYSPSSRMPASVRQFLTRPVVIIAPRYSPPPRPSGRAKGHMPAPPPGPPPGVPTSRPRNWALGLGIVGTLVACVLFANLTAAAGTNVSLDATDTSGIAQDTAAVVQAAPTDTPMPTAPNTPTPQPTATDSPIPTDTPIPTVCTDAGCSPWGYSFEPGNLIYQPPYNFCDYFSCIGAFWTDTNGYVEQCQDGEFSHSGGVSGSCSRHGGDKQPLYSH